LRGFSVCAFRGQDDERFRDAGGAFKRALRHADGVGAAERVVVRQAAGGRKVCWHVPGVRFASDLNVCRQQDTFILDEFKIMNDMGDYPYLRIRVKTGGGV
jgi:hypothetical protein